MKRISVVIIFILLFSPFSFIKAQENIPKKPNIIIILFDDLGYGDFSCYGNPTIKTPNIDRMAREGMKFTQFYSSAPVCTPSRAGLVTGQLPVRIGMMGKKVRVLFPNSTKGLPSKSLTIAEELKPAGYATACIGKWHLGDHSPYLPTDKGFDYYYGIPYSNDMGASNRNVYPPLPLIKNKKIIEQPVDQTTLTKRYTEEAIKFIENNKNHPFFLYLAHNFPHIPLYASDDFRGKSSRGLYGDVVEELDWSVGQVLDELRKTGLAKNTLVFVTSDNGPWWVSKGIKGGSAGILRGGKGDTWEGGMRVPCIGWWPGVIEGGVVTEALATNNDFFSTALALADVEPPTNRVIDGINLIPLLTGEKRKVRDFVWFYRNTILYAVRYGPWKLEVYTEPGYNGTHLVNSGSGIKKVYVPAIRVKHTPPLLFNLDKDPSERFNVAKDHPEIVSRMMEEIKKQENSFAIPSDLLAPRVNHSTLLKDQ